MEKKFPRVPKPEYDWTRLLVNVLQYPVQVSDEEEEKEILEHDQFNSYLSKQWQQLSKNPNCLRQTQAMFVRQRKVFHNTRTPLALIQSLFLASERGIIPPAWVLHELTLTFKEWAKSNGTKTLDQCFGLTLQRGQRLSAFKTTTYSRQDGILCFEICLLKTLLPRITIYQAAEMVADKFNDGYKNGKKKRTISANYLKDLYNRKWRKIIYSDLGIWGLALQILDGPDEDHRDFLSAFTCNGKFAEIHCIRCDKPFWSLDKTKIKTCQLCKKKPLPA